MADGRDKVGVGGLAVNGVLACVLTSSYSDRLDVVLVRFANDGRELSSDEMVDSALLFGMKRPAGS